MSILSIASAMIAFALFGLSTDAHHQQRLRARPSAKRKYSLKLCGWIAVAACCALAFAVKGAVYGAVFALGALSFGAAATFLCLNLIPVRPTGKARPAAKPRSAK
jgi:hypothetical protein